MQSASRMFLVKQLPDLSGKQATHSLRYYLFRTTKIVLRVQSEDNTYQLERKEDTSELARSKDRIDITKEEFDRLKTIVTDSIVRENYLISEIPQIKLHMYHDKFEGLNRIEARFATTEEAEKFVPLDWFGKEITNSPLGRDNLLLDLTDEEFKRLISE